MGSFGACTLLPGRCQLSNSLISPILPRTSFPASNMSGRGPPRIEGMTSLKVDNLTYRTTCDDLRRVFEKYGDVGDVYTPKDRFSRESRGFAFVRFYDRRDGEDAMHAMDGRMMDGRELRVQLARYGRPDDPPSRRHGGRSSRRSRSRSRSRSRRSRSRSPPEAAAVMIGAVAAMTPTAEAKERADRDHTAAVKVVTGAVRTAKARMTTETQGTLRKMITKPKETETTTADQGTARSGKKTTVERTAEVMIGTVTATIAMLKTIDVPSHALVRTPAPDLHRRIDGFTRVY